MNLEELATELGTSPTDLAAAAAGLGYPGLTPASPLAAEQEAALRARAIGSATPAAPTPQPPPGFAGPPPAQPPVGFAPVGQAPPVPNPYGTSYASNPSAWTKPAAQSTPPAAPPKQKTRVGLLLGVAAVAALIGVGAFVVSSGDDDGDSSDSAAVEQEAETTVPVGPTGPDGKPLTQAEKDGLAKMKEVEEANKAKACAALEPISAADQDDAPVPADVDTFEEVQQWAIDQIQGLSDLYEPAIAALPSQAEGMRKIQATYQGMIDSFAAATTPGELEQALDGLEQQFTSSGAWEAANELDAYAQESCGFSINQN